MLKFLTAHHHAGVAWVRRFNKKRWVSCRLELNTKHGQTKPTGI